MAYNHLETTIALDNLKAPLNPFPLDDQESKLNELRVRYRSYFVEYNVNEVRGLLISFNPSLIWYFNSVAFTTFIKYYQAAVMLPTMFSHDYGDEVCRTVALIDSNKNEFEILVETIKHNIYLTQGWGALRDFYNIRVGAWLILFYTGKGHFGLIVQDRFYEEITPPIFVPPMKFIIDGSNVPSHFVDDLSESTELLSYSHPPGCFNLTHDKKLTRSDINSGFLMLPHDEFGEYTFDESMDSIKLVDDCGNAWKCTLAYISFPLKMYKVGGEWSRLVDAKRLCRGEPIRVGVQPRGHPPSIYVMFDR